LKCDGSVFGYCGWIDITVFPSNEHCRIVFKVQYRWQGSISITMIAQQYSIVLEMVEMEGRNFGIFEDSIRMIEIFEGSKYDISVFAQHYSIVLKVQ